MRSARRRTSGSALRLVGDGVSLELPPGEEPRTRDHREHHDLADLVEAGDGAGARELMRAHIERSLTGSAIDALEQRERRAAGETTSEAS